jgi:hypothetical protein
MSAEAGDVHKTLLFPVNRFQGMLFSNELWGGILFARSLHHSRLVTKTNYNIKKGVHSS